MKVTNDPSELGRHISGSHAVWNVAQAVSPPESINGVPRVLWAERSFPERR